ncbi:hypothetical protein [Halalkalibacterium halodurans]|uniref:hypothetical protein n=1 Tax=Halalkalibacterium halodurans TaxID=86665 RepID=UPI0006A9CED7|nr:hypothetical protein [Halalkalibacterium halodurans]TES56185.1 phage portal protein [Halalkalibacterium halodurans]TPE70666.1 phage portal protein [Halalkalibacterium halodurans]
MEELKLHPEVAAIVAYLHERHKEAKLYIEEMPQDFELPALYIPPTTSFGSNDTVSTFAKSYTLNLKLFDKTKRVAVAVAESLHDEFQRVRMILPMLDVDGAPTGDYVRISRIDVRPGDLNTAVIVFQWTSRYYYDRPQYLSLETIEMRGGLKENE